MTWQEDTSLRDLDENVVIEATCLRCGHVWLQSALQLLLKVDHRNVRMDEVARHLACLRPGCRYVGVRINLLNNDDTSGFVGGMP